MAGNAAVDLREHTLPGGDQRRQGSDRRQFSYSFYLPERRSGIERRGNLAFRYRALARRMRFGILSAGHAGNP